MSDLFHLSSSVSNDLLDRIPKQEGITMITLLNRSCDTCFFEGSLNPRAT